MKDVYFIEKVSKLTGGIPDALDECQELVNLLAGLNGEGCYSNCACNDFCHVALVMRWRSYALKRSDL